MKKKAAIFVIMFAALLTLMIAGMTSANESWEFVGKGIYAPLETGATSSIYSLPSLDDYDRVAKARTDNMRKGLSPDDVDPAKILPEPKVLSLKGSVGSFTQLAINRGHFIIKNPYLWNGTKNIRLRRAGNLIIPEINTVLNNFVQAPNKRMYSFEENGTIWIIDGRNLSVKQAAKQQDRPARQKIAEQNDKFLDWASNPTWSPDSKYIAYTANRNVFNSNGREIWVYNLEKGHEKMVYCNKAPFRLLGWMFNNKFLIESWNGNKANLVLVNLKGEEELICREVDVTAVSSSMVAYKKDDSPKEITLMNLQSKKEIDINVHETQSNFSMEGKFSPNGKYFSITLNPGNGEKQIYIYDIQAQTQKLYTLPRAGYMVEAYNWLNEELLLVTLSKSGVTPETWRLKVNS